MYQSARRSTDHDGLHIYLAELAVERDWVGQCGYNTTERTSTAGAAFVFVVGVFVASHA